MSTAAFAGKRSFTLALIYALEHLVNHRSGGRFDTRSLLETIQSAPDLSEKLTPVLIDGRTFGKGGRIVLQPLEPKDSSPDHDQAFDVRKGQDMSLHFQLAEDVSYEQIESLVRYFNISARRRSIKLKDGSIGGLSFEIADRLAEALVGGQQDQPAKCARRAPAEYRKGLRQKRRRPRTVGPEAR